MPTMPTAPVLVEGWFPPSREHWELISYAWQFFPIVSAPGRETMAGSLLKP